MRNNNRPNSGMIFVCLPVALVLATGAAQPALAQSPSSPTAWSGLYLGLLGVATHSTEDGTTTRSDGVVSNGSFSERAEDVTHTAGGAGVVLGYQHQYANGIIAGLEADLIGLQHKDRQDTLGSNNNAYFGMPVTSIQRETEWISTARLRLGYGNGPWMVHATGGLALASMVQTRTQYEGVNNTVTVARFSETDRRIPLGWALGFGGAWQIAEGWSLSLDYLHTQFDEVRFSFPNARSGATNFTSVAGRDVRNDVTMRMLRIGVTYTFGGGLSAGTGQDMAAARN